jgi:hypothetical protein
MSFFGAVRLLVDGWSHGHDMPREEALPDIKPGAAAAWAKGERRRASRGPAAGDPCVTPDGRAGRIVELVDGTFVTLVCETR